MVKSRKKLLPIKIIIILLSLTATVMFFIALLFLGIKSLLDREAVHEQVSSDSIVLELNELS